jgi:hypothetical protein
MCSNTTPRRCSNTKYDHIKNKAIWCDDNFDEINKIHKSTRTLIVLKKCKKKRNKRVEKQRWYFGFFQQYIFYLCQDFQTFGLYSRSLQSFMLNIFIHDFHF